MVETGGLENRCTRKGTGGSNPSPLRHCFYFQEVCSVVIPILIPKSERITAVNREVNLTKRIETPQGWRYCRIVLSANGRVKPDVVLVNGKGREAPSRRILHRMARRCEASALVGRKRPCGRRRTTTAKGSRVKRRRQWRHHRARERRQRARRASGRCDSRFPRREIAPAKEKDPC